MIAIPRSRRVLIGALCVVALAGCSSSGDDSQSSAESSTPAAVDEQVADPPEPTADSEAEAVPTATPEPTPTSPPAPPLFGSWDQQIDLLTAPSGGGMRPILEWTPVDGVDHYAVYLYAPSGEIYWAWRGYTTSVPVGGEPLLADTSAGPSVTAGMTWAVIAYDSELLPVAVSPEGPIEP